MADGDGLGSKIIDAAEEVGEAVGSELKKFGKSATSQVTGSPDETAGTSASGQQQQKAQTQASPSSDAPSSFLGELKKIGSEAVHEITGHEQRAADVSKMAKMDEEFSEAESAVIKQKIRAIYDEYAAKRKQEEKQEEVVEQQREQVQEMNLEEKKRQQDTPNRAIAQTRAENKNYGAE